LVLRHPVVMSALSVTYMQPSFRWHFDAAGCPLFQSSLQ